MTNIFSVLLIENELSQAERILQTLADFLDDYRLSIAQSLADSLLDPPPADVILLRFTLLEGDVAAQVSLLAATYPDVPLILILPPGNASAEEPLLEALYVGAEDWTTLSEAGLLALGRRLSTFAKTWADVSALEQAKLQTIQYNQELQILLETSREISERLELMPTLEQIAEQAKSLLNADNFYVYFLAEDKHTMEPVLAIGPMAERARATPLAVDRGLIGTVVTTHKGALLNFAGRYEPLKKSPHGQDEHLLCVPLIAMREINGLMVAARSQKTPFVEDDLRFFENMVQQVASTVNNARLFQETQCNLNELAVLYEASATVSVTLDIEAVLDTLIRQMVQTLDVSRGYIARWDKNHNQGIVLTTYTNETHTPPTSTITPGMTIHLNKYPALKRVIQQQNPVILQLSDPIDETERAAMLNNGCLTRLIAPLVATGEPLGWAELWETRRERFFSSQKIRLVRTLANQTAAALSNAQYLKQLQQSLDETAALYQTASALAAAEDSQTIMSIVLKEYLRVLNLEQGNVIIFDFEAKAGVVKISIQDEQPVAQISSDSFSTVREGWKILLENNPIYHQLMRTHQPVIIKDTRAGWMTPASISGATLVIGGGWSGAEALSLLIIPVEIRGAIVGAIVVEATRSRRIFEHWEITLGQAMADQLGVALQNLQLYEAEQQRRRQAETLREVARVVGSSLDLDEVLERILDQLGQVIAYDSAAIHLLEHQQRRIIAGRGFQKGEKVIGLTIPMTYNNSEPGSIVIRTHRPMVVDNVAAAFPAFSEPRYTHIKSWIGAPLIARDKVIGLITIDRVEAGIYRDEDAQLALAFANQVAIALENARLYDLEVREFARELTIAEGIQESLLPQVVPEIPGFQICGRILPARHIGGDFFHFFSPGEGRLGVAVGDVSGKGIPASLYMAVVMTAIDAQMSNNPAGPGELLSRLHTTLHKRLSESKMNVGVQVATFTFTPNGEAPCDPKAGGSVMNLASGGMVAPIIATQTGCYYLPVSGLPVGAPLPEIIYREKQVSLKSFAAIIFTSDGIVEAQNEAGELFGFERLEDAVNQIAHTRHAEQIANYIIQAAQNFVGEAEQADDMTVVVVVKEE
jgi:serine phosphatase RsbU (regulator of sigma subunit)